MLEAPEGAYGPVAAWRSAESWLRDLREALATDKGEAARARARIAIDTLLRVAGFEAISADGRTGRGVATSHATVAQRLGMSSKTVQRCRDLLIVLGFAVEITRGRHLTRAERAEARRLHGSHQDRAASVRALTQPRPAVPVENVHPPRRGSVKPLSHAPEVVKNQHAQARAAEESQSRGRQTPTSRPRSRDGRRRRAWTPWPSTHIDFARRLQERMPALQRYHPATVCQLLSSSGVDPTRWTVPTLLHVLELSSSARGGLYFARFDQMRNPLAYTAAVLQNSVDPAAETPLEISSRERLERQQHRELVRAAEAARRIEVDSPAAREAREAFFAGQHRTPAPRPAAGTQKQLIRALLGATALYDLSPAGQLTVAALTRLHTRLQAQGWTTRISPSQITATRRDGSTLTLTRSAAIHYEISMPGHPPRTGTLVIDDNNINAGNETNDSDCDNGD